MIAIGLPSDAKMLLLGKGFADLDLSVSRPSVPPPVDVVVGRIPWASSTDACLQVHKVLTWYGRQGGINHQPVVLYLVPHASTWYSTECCLFISWATI